MDTAPLPPPAAAAQLGVSEGTLRRWARIYAEVFEEIPEGDTGGRLYPGEVLERLAAAKVMLNQKRFPSYRAALERLRDELGHGGKQELEPDLADLVSEVQTLKDEVAELRANQVDLKLRLALQGGERPGVIRRAWWFFTGRPEGVAQR
ncbi:MAG: MerR family transcriptional regulator [Trueperaceae bacterium]|nr:MAG: MerR family transcriptional regulator [Trueperaceae bacterium]